VPDVQDGEPVGTDFSVCGSYYNSSWECGLKARNARRKNGARETHSLYCKMVAKSDLQCEKFGRKFTISI
jgi:hypothetical protein